MTSSMLANTVRSFGQSGRAVMRVRDGVATSSLSKLGKAKGPQAPTLPCLRG